MWAPACGGGAIEVTTMIETPTSTQAITASSRVRFEELTIVREAGRDPILGCKRSRRYLEVDDDTLVAVEFIDSSPSLRAAQVRLVERYACKFDLVQLVEVLRDRGMVASVDGEEQPSAAPDAQSRHPWLHRLPPARLAWLHRRSTLLVPLALGTVWFVLVLRHLWLIPNPTDIWLPTAPLLVPVIAFAMLMLFAYLHELAHFFMARSFGIDAIVKLSRRYHIIVLETDVSNAWTLSRRQRLAIFAAGSMFNLTVLSIIGIVRVAAVNHLVAVPDALWPWLRLTAYVNFLPLIFQLAFFARTDIYFAFLVASGQRNLMLDARAFRAWKATRVVRRIRATATIACVCGANVYDDDPYCVRCHTTRRVEDPNKWPFSARDRFALAGFAAVVSALPVLVVVYLASFGVSAQTHFFTLALTTVTDAFRSGGLAMAIEALLFSALYLMQLAMIGFVALRGVRRLAAAAWKHLPTTRLQEAHL